MANFSTFFAKVRYLPYNAKKCAKISHFFKQNLRFFWPIIIFYAKEADTREIIFKCLAYESNSPFSIWNSGSI